VFFMEYSPRRDCPAIDDPTQKRARILHASAPSRDGSLEARQD
jgi:hypothetical protein